MKASQCGNEKQKGEVGSREVEEKSHLCIDSKKLLNFLVYFSRHPTIRPRLFWILPSFKSTIKNVYFILPNKFLDKIHP